MLERTRRAGVPVLKRPSEKPSDAQRGGQTHGGLVSEPSAHLLLLAQVHQGLEEGAGGEEHGASGHVRSRRRAPRRETRPPSASTWETSASSDGEVALGDERGLHGRRVGVAVAEHAGGRTAGPLEALSVLKWVPVRSAARPISPPSASSSRTRWPLAVPPTAGLQLMTRDAIALEGEGEGGQAHARARERRLAAGMAQTHHDDVVARLHAPYVTRGRGEGKRGRGGGLEGGQGGPSARRVVMFAASALCW